jgi:hypothetical protein
LQASPASSGCRILFGPSASPKVAHAQHLASRTASTTPRRHPSSPQEKRSATFSDSAGSGIIIYPHYASTCEYQRQRSHDGDPAQSQPEACQGRPCLGLCHSCVFTFLVFSHSTKSQHANCIQRAAVLHVWFIIPEVDVAMLSHRVPDARSSHPGPRSSYVYPNGINPVV